MKYEGTVERLGGARLYRAPPNLYTDPKLSLDKQPP